MKRLALSFPAIANIQSFKFNPRPVFTNILRYKKVLILAVVILAVGFGISKIQKGSGAQSQFINTVSNSGNPSIGINKEFNFPIYSNGKKTEKNLKLVLTTAERSDKILINGKPASAKDGRDFLILNLEITNPTQDKLNIRPVDFFRLKDDQGQQFAADVHNDPVKAEPISIRKTRVGYIVDESKKSFKFLVGEINGEKQEIEINI